MDSATIQRLNQINRDFYQKVAADFDETRGQPWPGWERLLPYLEVLSAISVLDVGCGNGRFGVFLGQRLANTTIRYRGLDSNATLLEHARQSLAAFANLHVTLDERDVVENPPDSGEYDLVVAFGMLHHLPGTANRLHWVTTLAARVAPAGLLAFACWRFYEDERMRQRIVAWPPDINAERHDYLLDWRRGTRALRYCHYVDDTEHESLVATTGLREIASYRADGPGGTANRYSLLRNENSVRAA